MRKIVMVMFDGPHADRIGYGDEFPVWSVSSVTEDCDDIDIEHFTSHEAAEQAAIERAERLGVELDWEADRA